MDYRQNLQRVIERIESSLEGDINLDRLSTFSHMSIYHFSRLFAFYTGLSPIEYVRRRKMLHAAGAICSGEKILTVAVQYGYSSHAAFSKSFKKVFGCSPSTYRKIKSFSVPPCINLYTQERIISGRIMKAYETEHLIIRNFQFDDWKEIQELAIDKESSDASLYDHPWPTSDSDCQKIAKHFSERDSFWAVCLKESNLIIGLITFNGIDENRALDFGHLFHTKHNSEKVTTEAIQRMVQYVFDELEVDRIRTHNAAEWKGQLEPLFKLGMRKIDECMSSFSTNPDGTPNEFLAYTLEITRDEWIKQRKKSGNLPEVSYTIVFIDIEGDAASAKVELKREKLFAVDYVFLYKFIDKWRIVSAIDNIRRNDNE